MIRHLMGGYGWQFDVAVAMPFTVVCVGVLMLVARILWLRERRKTWERRRNVIEHHRELDRIGWEILEGGRRAR